MASQTMQSLGIDRMPPADRLDLAFDIWESLAGDATPPWLSPELRQELHRRDAQMDADPTIGLTRDQVWAAVRRGR